MFDNQIDFIIPFPGHLKQTNALINESKKISSPKNSLMFEGQIIFATQKTYLLNNRTIYATIFFDQKRFSDESLAFYKRLNEVENTIHQGKYYSKNQVKGALDFHVG